MNIANLNIYVTNQGKESARGIAASVVAIAHAYGLFIFPFLGADYYFGQLFSIAAHQAVMIFFIISGYLITLSILNNVRRNEEFNFTKYISSRLARIHPPLFFAVILSIFFLGIIRLFNLRGVDSSLPFAVGNFEPSRKVFLLTFEDIKNVVMMRNGMLEVDGPLWSLYIEWRIYIVMGVLAFLVTSKKLTSKIIMSFIFIYVVNALISVNEHAFFYLSVWLLGALLALIPSAKKILTGKYRFFIFLILSAIVILWAFFSPAMLMAGGNKFGLFENTYQLLICILWCFIVIPDHKVKPTLFSTISIWLGNFSYSLYILHFPIMLFVFALSHRMIEGSLNYAFLAAILSLLSAVAISRVSSIYFENKIYFQKPIYKILNYIVSLMRQCSHKLRPLLKDD